MLSTPIIKNLVLFSIISIGCESAKIQRDFNALQFLQNKGFTPVNGYEISFIPIPIASSDFDRNKSIKVFAERLVHPPGTRNRWVFRNV